jgi:hypothetical protein
MRLENIMPFGRKRIAMCIRRKRAEVTDFGTRVWSRFGSDGEEADININLFPSFFLIA